MIKHLNLYIISGLLVTIIIFATFFNVEATRTMVWELNSFDDFEKGEFDGTVVDSSGLIKIGLKTFRMELPEDAGVWSYAVSDTGDVFLGTGNRGAIYMLRDKKLFFLTETESVAITSMVIDSKGNLYAGGMPGAEIYKFTPDDIKKMISSASAGPRTQWKEREGKSDKKGKVKEKKEEETKGSNLSESETKSKKTALKYDYEELKEGKPETGKQETGKGENKDKEGSESKQLPQAQKRKGPEPWVKLKDEEQIWSLVIEKKRNLIFAGTGPNGRVYSIDSSGRVNIYAETEEEHVLSLTFSSAGKLLAGTGNHGRLFLLEGPGRGTVLWDFDATEVRRVVVLKGNEALKEEIIVCSVNKYKSVSPLSVSKSSVIAKVKPLSTQTSSFPSIEGEGEIIALWGTKGKRVLFRSSSSTFTFLEPAEGGSGVYAGESQKGRIYRVNIDASYSILLDLDERQVLCFCLECKNRFIGTSDPASVYRVSKEFPLSAYYISDVFDSGFPARWGKIIIRGEGDFSWQTRSGNTSEPDEWWSDWSEKFSSPEGLITVPQGRFLQFRLKISPSCSVWNVKIYYLPANQQAIIKNITVDGDGGGLKEKKSGEKDKKNKKDSIMEIKWNVDNPDDDTLGFKLFFAKEGEQLWIPVLKEGEELNDTKYNWDTSSIPAGYYLVKVVLSDEPSNDRRFVQEHYKISKPVLVDNDPPSVSIKVKVSNPSTVKIVGKVTDNFSRICSIQYAIDGKQWKEVFPDDDIFDSPIETFTIDETGLSPGAHTISVRVRDEGGNLSVAGENFVIGK